MDIITLCTILNCLAISYLIIYLTVLIVKLDADMLYMAMATIIGAVLIFKLDNFCLNNIWITIIIILINSIFLVMQNNLRKIMLTAVVYMLVSLVIVGSISVVGKFIGSTQYAVVGVALSILAMRIAIFSLVKNRHSNTYIYRIAVENGDRICECKGYYDSGNKLAESNGKGMVVISKALQEKLKLTICGTTRVGTVGGVQELNKVKITFKIYFKGGKNRIYHTYAVVSESFANKEYDIILHRDMGEYND